jgi:hypothetical protein
MTTSRSPAEHADGQWLDGGSQKAKLAIGDLREMFQTMGTLLNCCTGTRQVTPHRHNLALRNTPGNEGFRGGGHCGHILRPASACDDDRKSDEQACQDSRAEHRPPASA